MDVFIFPAPHLDNYLVEDTAHVWQLTHGEVRVEFMTPAHVYCSERSARRELSTIVSIDNQYIQGFTLLLSTRYYHYMRQIMRWSLVLSEPIRYRYWLIYLVWQLNHKASRPRTQVGLMRVDPHKLVWYLVSISSLLRHISLPPKFQHSWSRRRRIYLDLDELASTAWC